jgi:hypothetical protein
MAHDGGYELEVSEDDSDVAYLKLPGHPGMVAGCVKRSVSLRELVGDYTGPDIHFEFGEGNVLIGIELVG